MTRAINLDDVEAVETTVNENFHLPAASCRSSIKRPIVLAR